MQPEDNKSITETATLWTTRLLDTSLAVSGLVVKAAAIFLLAGVVLWAWPALPFDVATTAVGGWVWRIILLILLASPGLFVLLFGIGLKQLAAIPPQLLEKSEGSRSEVANVFSGSSINVAGGRTRKLIGLMQGLWRIGRSSFDLKDSVLGGVALVRMFNPIVLIAVVSSIVLGTCLSLAAAVRLLWWALV